MSDYWRDGPAVGLNNLEQHLARERRKSEESLRARRKIEERREKDRQAEQQRREEEVRKARERFEQEEAERSAAELEAHRQKLRADWIQHGGDPARFDELWRTRLRDEYLLKRAEAAERERRERAVSVRSYW